MTPKNQLNPTFINLINLGFVSYFKAINTIYARIDSWIMKECTMIAIEKIALNIIIIQLLQRQMITTNNEKYCML